MQFVCPDLAGIGPDSVWESQAEHAQEMRKQQESHRLEVDDLNSRHQGVVHRTKVEEHARLNLTCSGVCVAADMSPGENSKQTEHAQAMRKLQESHEEERAECVRQVEEAHAASRRNLAHVAGETEAQLMREHTNEMRRRQEAADMRIRALENAHKQEMGAAAELAESDKVTSMKAQQDRFEHEREGLLQQTEGLSSSLRKASGETVCCELCLLKMHALSLSTCDLCGAVIT